jgi:hypothetical protein
MKSKKYEESPDFARIVGRVPCVKESLALIHIDLDEIVGTFGPPEIQQLKTSKRLFWNFRTIDDVGRFSLWVKRPLSRKSTRNLDIEVSTGSERDWETFFNWVSDRLSAVSNCEELPVVINGSRFVIVPV